MRSLLPLKARHLYRSQGKNEGIQTAESLLQVPVGEKSGGRHYRKLIISLEATREGTTAVG